MSITCPFCLEKINSGVTTCPYCAESIDEEDKGAPAELIQESPREPVRGPERRPGQRPGIRPGRRLNRRTVPTQEGAGAAVAGFILGLLGLLLVSVTLSTLGIVFASLGLKSIRGGLATAGLVLGAIGLPLAILMKIVSGGACCLTF